MWLEHEPTADEVISALDKWDVTKFNELVFCGFGEPTEALDVLIPVAKYAKEHFNIPIRINTNGLGNLIHGRDITPDFAGIIDTISISLNTPNKKEYLEIVRPKFGEPSFDAMLNFAESAAKVVPKVIMSTVDTTISHEDEDECRKICEGRGVTYRIREWEG